MGKLKHLRLRLAAIPLSLLLSAAFAQQSPFNTPEMALIEHELEYEKKKTEYLQKGVIDRILGPDEAIVIVDVEFGLNTTTTRTSARERRAERRRNIAEVEYLLPGVPNPRAVTEAEPTGETKEEAGQQERTTVEVNVALQRQIITVLHDERVPEDKLEAVRGAIVSAMRIDDRRGDRIDFQKTRFARPFMEELLKPLVLVPIILAVLLLLFLFGPLAGFFRSYVKMMKERSGTEVTVDSKFENPEEDGAGGEGGAGGGGGLLAGELEALEEEKKKYKPFHYVDEENLKRLIYLIRRESPRVIALVISYLKAEHVKEILLSLPPEMQSKVAIEMAIIRQMTRDQVMKIDDDIREKIDFLIGGLEHLLKVLDQVDPATRDGILDYLQNEKPELYDKVRKFILKFEDIKNFPDQAMQTILSFPDLKNSALLAKALKEAEVEVVNKFFANMSSNAVQLVKEEMQYIQTLTPLQVEEERKKILDVIRKLESDGKIFVREKPKSNALEGDEVISEESETSSEVGSAQDYYQTGVSSYEVQNYEEAISYLEYALSIDAGLTDAHSYLAASYYALGKIEDALSHYEVVLSMNPEDAEVAEFVEQLKLESSRR